MNTPKDTTGIIGNLEALLTNIHLAEEHAAQAMQLMEPFPDLDNERRRLQGICGVLGSLSYSAASSPLIALSPLNGVAKSLNSPAHSNPS